MGKDMRADQAFQEFLEGNSRSSSREMHRMAALAAALRPAREAAGPSDQFRRRLRNELLARASMDDEEVFAALLDDIEIDAPAEMRPLVAVASALAPPSLPAPDPSFRFQLRNHLIATTARGSWASRTAASIAAMNARMRRSFRVVGATAMASVMLMGSALALVAAQDAIPGDPLYGLKRLHERAQLVPLSGEGEGKARLGFARERLDEIEAMVDRRVTDDQLYVGTLDDMDRLTTSGAQLLLDAFDATGAREPLEFVKAFADGQAGGLKRLVELVPPGARPAALSSLSLLEETAREVERTLQACDLCPPSAFFDGPEAIVEGRQASGQPTCACEPVAQPNQPANNGSDSQPGPGGSGGNGGGSTPPDDDPPAVDAPDDLPDELEEPVEDLIDDLVDVVDETLPPLPSPSPSLEETVDEVGDDLGL